MINEKVKVAVIGAGEIGTKAHIPAYLKNPNVELVGLVDADEKKLQKASKKYRLKNCYTSFDQLINNTAVDAISVCTPPTSHAEIVLKAFANDIHVLCEKPLATSTEDGQKMLEAAKRQKKALMVGFNLRYYPNYLQTANLIKSGRLGHTHLIEFNLQSPNPLISWSKSPWFFNAQSGGGVLLDKGPHAFDMINYMFDDFPISVNAVSSTFFESGVEDSCVCILEYPKKKMGLAIVSWLPSRVIELLSVHGTSQNVFVSPEFFIEANATDLLEIALFRKATNLLVNLKFQNLPVFKINRVDTFQLEIDSFVNQARSGKYDYSTALSGANVLLTCNSALQSLKSGRKVSINPIKINFSDDKRLL